MALATKIVGLENSHVWTTLPDVSQVSERLSGRERILFSTIGRMLARARQTHRFAVTLLHSHFQVDPDEILVEESDASGRIVTSVQKQSATTGLAPKSWKFEY